MAWNKRYYIVSYCITSDPQHSNIYAAIRDGSGTTATTSIAKIAEDGTRTNIVEYGHLTSSEPEFVAVDVNGNIYAELGRVITKYDATGVKKWENDVLDVAGPVWIRGIAVDVRGNVFAADGVNGTTVKIDSTGRLVWKTTDGEEYSDYNYYNVTADLNGDVIISRTCSSGTVVAKKDGSTGEDLWSYTEAEAFISTLAKVATDLQGNVYTPYITKLDSAGNKVWRYTFNYGCVTTDVYGNVYASKFGQVVKKVPEGYNQWFINDSNVDIDGIVVDTNYNVYIGNMNSGVCKFIQKGDSVIYYSEDVTTGVPCRIANKIGTDWYVRPM